MGKFLAVLFVLLAVGIGASFYMGWLTVETSDDRWSVHINLTVNKDKLKKDEEKAKKELEKAGEKLKEKTGQ